MKAWDKFQSLPPIARILIVIVIIILIVTISRAIKNSVTKARERKIFEQDYKKYCTTQSKPSYPNTTYYSLAGKIYEAGCPGVFCYGTDEDSIFDVFREMNTDCDVVLLARAFGKRQARGTICIDIPYVSPEEDKCRVELGIWLQTELSSDAFGEINRILSSKGITSRF